MGIPWDEVHEEAHAMEHSISPRLETKMLEMIGEVRTCPHGHPIGDYPREPGEPIPAVPVGSELVVLRLENEAEEMLHYLKERGIEPGYRYTVTDRRGHGDDAITELRNDDGGSTHEVDDRLARTVSVLVVDARRRPGVGRRRGGRRAAAARPHPLGHVNKRGQAPIFTPWLNADGAHRQNAVCAPSR